MMKERIDAAVFTSLKSNDPSLTALDLSCRKLQDSDIHALLQALAQNTCLTTLNLRDNALGDEGAKALAQNTFLTTLDVRYNQIGAEGAKALAQNTFLTTLDVRFNQIGAEGAKALAQNTFLTTLDVRFNQIGAEGAKALAQNTRLTTLKLWGNAIGDEGAKVLAQNTTLTTLNLCGNAIGTEGAKALAQNTCLTALNVGLNAIGDEGATALAQNTTLTTLDLRSNQIGVEGAKALAQNTVLTTLDVANNQIGAEEEDALKQVILANQQALMTRRQQWLYTLMLLATASPEPCQENTFDWARLPRDLKRMIILLLELKGTQGLGKTPAQLEKASAIIFAQPEVVKERWRAKRGIKLMESNTAWGLRFTLVTSVKAMVSPERDRMISEQALEAEEKATGVKSHLGQ
jgi:hypothetical protein